MLRGLYELLKTLSLAELTQALKIQPENGPILFTTVAKDAYIKGAHFFLFLSSFTYHISIPICINTFLQITHKRC